MVTAAWQYSDAGRPRGGDKGDCTVRALALARNIPYQAAWTLLYRIQGEQRRCGFGLVQSLRARDARLGLIRPIVCRAVKGQPRTTVDMFCRAHPHGRFILQVAHHTVALIDGIVWDAWDCTSKCVYAAWEVEAASEK